MSVNFDSETTLESERVILSLIIGICLALKEEIILIETAEQMLFKPFYIKKFREKMVSNNIIELIELGCELDDVKTLIPEKLIESINEILDKAKKILKQI